MILHTKEASPHAKKPKAKPVHWKGHMPEARMRRTMCRMCKIAIPKRSNDGVVVEVQVLEPKGVLLFWCWLHMFLFLSGSIAVCIPLIWLLSPLARVSCGKYTQAPLDKPLASAMEGILDGGARARSYSKLP